MMLDKYVVDMRKGIVLDDVDFELNELSTDGAVHCVPY